MSEAVDRGNLDLREQITRIDRAIAETTKLREESNKLIAEQHKLMSESRKVSRDYFLSAILALATLVGGVLGAATFVLRLLGRG